MNKRPCCLIFILLLSLSPWSGVCAQTLIHPLAQEPAPSADEKPAPSQSKPPEPPADRTAFNEAMRTSDPQKKIEALEKFLTDFPQSPGVARAHDAILDTLIKNWPDQEEKILTQSNRIIDAAPVSSKSNTYNTVATKLLDAGILLDDAEQFASRGLALLDEKEFVERQKKIYEERKMTLPSDEELANRFRSSRAPNLTTLGQIYLKTGRASEAQKVLKEAYEANPSLTAAAVGLAELAEKAGNYSAALEYAAAAALSGRMKPESRQQFEALYRKTHNGSLDGLEEMLDARYKETFPHPFEVEPYKATPSRSDRVVLAEVFTGASCPPCVGADVAFDVVMERYSRQDVAVLMYHLHIPRPDPIANPATKTRSEFYGVRGVPSILIDGESDGKGGGPRDAAKAVFDRVNLVIEKRLETPAEAQIGLDAQLEAGVVKVKVKVRELKKSPEQLRLQLALVENELRYSGENGIRFHPLVVRDMAGPDADGFALHPSGSTILEHEFDVAKISAALGAYLDDYEVNGRHGQIKFIEKKHAINAGGLSVVAFVQDRQSKQVLQAAVVKVTPAKS